ncbi:desumoylating isopeptidase 2-like [Stylonychia lemnae]|uniref:Desumoylating isopeptidase 2-like n=1 Tax=Stylonychia lemnae TaxID=5949 RepID=A0A078AA43_STYLE|nr:desumoylating isopeptidase 2-like [Stylonychia lemnae]|eukprot:CDW79059.1 desumoylating isopeptidase 2-like [Stylonychia lemnae]
MQNASPTSKMRLSLEEDILNAQGDEWDDILTPSVVHNADSIAKQTEYKDLRNIGGDFEAYQRRSIVQQDQEQRIGTQHMESRIEESAHHSSSNNTFHASVKDEYLKHKEEDMDPNTIGQDKIIVNRGRIESQAYDQDQETIDHYNKLVNESPFSYSKYMRQQDSNTRKAINDQHNQQLTNEIIPNFHMYTANIKNFPSGLESAQFSLRQPNAQQHTALLNNYPHQNVTININNDTYVNYNVQMPLGQSGIEVQNGSDNQIQSIIGIKTQSEIGIKNNNQQQHSNESNNEYRQQQEHLNDRGNQKRGRTAPFQHNNNDGGRYRKVSDLIMNFKQTNLKQHEVFSENQSQADNYGLQGLFYHHDGAGGKSQQNDGPSPYQPQNTQYLQYMGATTKSMGRYPMNQQFNLITRAQSQPGNDVPSKIRTAENFFNAKQNIHLYGLPNHMIKSFEKKRSQMRSRESAATQIIRQVPKYNPILAQTNYGYLPQGAQSQTSGFYNRTVASAGTVNKRFQKRGELPKNLFQRGAMNNSASRESKSGNRSPINNRKGILMSQGSDFINQNSQPYQQLIHQQTSSIYNAFGSPPKQSQLDNHQNSLNPYQPLFDNSRPFSQGNQFQAKSPLREAYQFSNTGMTNNQTILQNMKAVHKSKKNSLPPLISPPKPPPILIDFESQFDINMKQLMEQRQHEIVYLNIYNVSSFNKFSEFLGFGFYHTSVEIYKHEFSYGGHDYDCSGIVCVEAGNSAGLTLKEKLPVGVTFYNEDEIDEIIRQFGDFWIGKDYDPFSYNCNCFTERFISHIVDKEEYYYPNYVNRFTKLGSLLKMWFKPLQALVGDIVNYEDDKNEKPIEQDQIQPLFDDYRYDRESMIMPGVSGNLAPPLPQNLPLNERALSGQNQKPISPNKSLKIEVISNQSQQNRLGSPMHPGSDFHQYQQQYYNEQMFISHQIHIDQCMNQASVARDKGDQYYQTQDFDSAMRNYQEALDFLSELDTEIYPQIREMVTQLLLSMASCCQITQMYDYVIHYCSQCIEIDQLNERAYQKRANTFLLLGNYLEARADLELAQKISPEDLIIKEELKFVEDKIQYGDVFTKINKARDVASNEVSQFNKED